MTPTTTSWTSADPRCEPRPADKPRRQTARGARTRAGLIAAARGVFERDGYLEARIVDIAAAAGVATGTFYTHFAAKDEIFLAVLAELQDEMLHAGVDGASEGKDLLHSVEKANRAYLEAYWRNARLMGVMEQVAAIDDTFHGFRMERSRAFIDRSAAAIVRLQDAGLADRELDPLVTARSLNAMVSKMAYVTFVAGEDVAFDDLVRTLTRLWMNALRMPA